MSHSKAPQCTTNERMRRKDKGPTMKNSQVEVKGKGTKDEVLQQQFKVLQQDWDSYKKSKTRSSKAMAKAQQVQHNSPRNLMPSFDDFQQRFSPSGGWNVRTNDLAVKEILGDRRDVIESGGLKGRRRLFKEAEDETEMMGCNGLVQECEVRSVSFCDSDDGDDRENDSGGSGSKVLHVCFQRCSSSSSSCSSSSSSSSSMSGENVEKHVVEEEEKVEKHVVEEEEKVVESVEEVKRVAIAFNGGSGRNGRSWMVVVGWLVIALIVYGICIVSLGIFGGCGDEHEVILVPT